MTEGKRPGPRRRVAAVVVSAALSLSGCSLLLLSSGDTGSDGIDAATSTAEAGTLRYPQQSRQLASGSGRGGVVGDKTSPTGPFRHVYFCGVGPSVAAALFPTEFDPRTSSFGSLRSGPKPTKHDLLLAGYAHAESGCARDRPELNGRILYFPGKMIFFNFEAADTQGGPRPVNNAAKKLHDACHSMKGEKTCDQMQGTVASDVPALELPGRRFNYLPPSDRAYVIGPHPDSSHSVQVSVAAMQWLEHSQESMRYMWDHSRKPVNTGEHFAIFLASSCIPFRDEAVKRIAAQTGEEIHVTDRWLRVCDRLTPDPSKAWRGGRSKKPRIVAQPDHTPRSSYDENYRIMSKYKFAIVMENTYREGYVTEKIMNAFKSGAVPIWYGGKEYALNIFNPEAFIYYDVEDPVPALRKIEYLLKHEDAYEKVLRAPILKDGNRTVEEYFSLRDDIGGGRLKNRIRRMIGMDDESGPMSEPKQAIS